MAYFSTGVDKEKLMILYALKKAGMPLSAEQLTAVVCEHGVENYFAVAQHLIGLDEAACIAAVPSHRIRTVAVTKRGEEIVNLFAGTLPKSLREALDASIASKGEEFRRENTAQAETRTHTDGSFTTSLALVENGDAFFEIRIKLPAAKYTRIAERNWEKMSAKLYMDTLIALTADEPEAAAAGDGAEKPEGE